MNNFFTERVVKHRNRQPKEVVASLSLKLLKKFVDVVLRDTFWGQWLDSGNLQIFSNLNNSTIL